jgi:copper transport protein
MDNWVKPFFVLLCFVVSKGVWAHAILVHSSPKDYSKLQTTPKEAVLQFNGKIEKSVTQISLLDNLGKKIPLPQPSKNFAAGSADTLIIPFPALKSGDYLLQYRILASDGHATPGVIHFSILRKPSL